MFKKGFKNAILRDRWNEYKYWHVKRSKCGHWYLVQQMYWEDTRTTWRRLGKRQIESIFS